ncbi:MAG: hypothetical protein JWR77_2235, partial [Rhizorhabdus sp.]|nr:hypothetical protein [Rhizorhabdus sp.]
FEDAGLAAAISDRMLDRVTSDMQNWLDRGLDFGRIAFNAAAAEFRRDNVGEKILAGLSRMGIDPRLFELEVTETVFLGRGAEYVGRALSILSKAGVSIALDDFGTGYASLSHLKQFPVDIIKIDRSFVRMLEEDAGDEAIIRAVINLGQSLGIRIVAEGIETSEQARILFAKGCDYGQGFWFGKAQPAEAIPALIANWALKD